MVKGIRELMIDKYKLQRPAALIKERKKRRENMARPAPPENAANNIRCKAGKGLKDYE